MARGGTLRVALVGAGELFGGVERHLLGMAAWLRREGHEFLLVLFHDGELAAQARAAGIEPHVLATSGSFDLGAPRRLGALLAEHRIGVVHAHGYRAVVNAALAARHHRCGLVRTVHGLVEPGGGFGLDALKDRLYVGLENWATRSAGAVVCCVTEDLRQRRGGRAGEHTVHNGIDPFTSESWPRPDDLPEGPFRFAAVGRVSAVKELDTAIRALREPGCPGDVVLDIIGTGPSVPDLEELVGELGLAARVRFLGFRQDILAYLSHIDALVMPSRHEGLPYTILEAMACGTPIIAARTGGLPEVIEDGRTGRLVPPGDPAAWARAMGDVAGDPRAAGDLGAAARESQARKHSLDAMGQAYWRIYTEAGGRE